MYVNQKRSQLAIGLNGGFGQTQAASDAKVAFTSQFYDLQYMAQYNQNREGGSAVSADAGYALASTALRELSQYDDWSSSFFGPALGGYMSKKDLVNGFQQLASQYKSKIDTTKVTKTKSGPATALQAADRAIKDTPTHPVIRAKTCEEDPLQAAIDKYGVFWGRFPGAQLLTCHRTAVLVTTGVVGGLLILAILGPYIKLITTFSKKTNFKRYKR